MHRASAGSRTPRKHSLDVEHVFDTQAMRGMLRAWLTSRARHHRRRFTFRVTVVVEDWNRSVPA